MTIFEHQEAINTSVANARLRLSEFLDPHCN